MILLVTLFTFFSLHAETEMASLKTPISSIKIKSLGSNHFGCKFLRKTVFIDRIPYSRSVERQSFKYEDGHFDGDYGVINHAYWSQLLNTNHHGAISQISFDGIEIYTPLHRDMKVVSQYNHCLNDSDPKSIPIFVHQVFYLSIKWSGYHRPISVRWNNISRIFEAQDQALQDHLYRNKNRLWAPLSRFANQELIRALSPKKWATWTSIEFRFNGAVVIGIAPLLNPFSPVISIPLNGFDF